MAEGRKVCSALICPRSPVGPRPRSCAAVTTAGFLEKVAMARRLCRA